MKMVFLTPWKHITDRSIAITSINSALQDRGRLSKRLSVEDVANATWNEQKRIYLFVSKSVGLFNLQAVQTFRK